MLVMAQMRAVVTRMRCTAGLVKSKV